MTDLLGIDDGRVVGSGRLRDWLRIKNFERLDILALEFDQAIDCRQRWHKLFRWSVFRAKGADCGGWVGGERGKKDKE